MANMSLFLFGKKTTNKCFVCRLPGWVTSQDKVEKWWGEPASEIPSGLLRDKYYVYLRDSSVEKLQNFSTLICIFFLLVYSLLKSDAPLWKRSPPLPNFQKLVRIQHYLAPIKCYFQIELSCVNPITNTLLN